VGATLLGRDFDASSGITRKVDGRNHRPHKSLFMGAVRAEVCFRGVGWTADPAMTQL
jgi:hypothetical protein